MAIPPTCLHGFLHPDPEIMYRRLVDTNLWSGDHTKEEFLESIASHRRMQEAIEERERATPAAPGYLGATPIDLAGAELAPFVNEVGRELAACLINRTEDLSRPARKALSTLQRLKARRRPWYARLWRALRPG